MDRLEERTTVSESLGSLGAGVGALAGLGWTMRGFIDQKTLAAQAKRGFVLDLHRGTARVKGSAPDRLIHRASAGESGFSSQHEDHAGDWLPMKVKEIINPVTASNSEPGGKSPYIPFSSTGPASGGGPASQPRGGAGSSQTPTGRGAILPFNPPPPASSQALSNPLGASVNVGAPSVQGGGNVPVPQLTTAGSAGKMPAPQQASTALQQTPTAGSHTLSPLTAPPFALDTLDFNDGTVLFPGVTQFGSLGGSVDLRAQVTGATVNSYSWNTSGLTLANSISGGSTFDLTFKWNSTNATAGAMNSVTLTVTDNHSNVVTQTYQFELPSGGGSTAAPTWPTVINPGYSTPLSSDYADQYVGVNQNSGALDTTIALPSYNPNVTPVTLDYASQAANPQPIVDVHHILDPAQATPSQVQAQLSFDSSGGSTYTFNTSSFNPGDIQAIALAANASSLSTGRYAYTVTVADDRTSNTTFTYNDTTTVINDSGSALGAGWTVDGLESIVSASGGVIVDLSAGQSLWFASSGSSYVTPANDPDFSTLAAVSGGGWTRTLKDGTVLTFNSGGQETKVVDLNGNTTTYSYSGGNLTSITDPYGKVTTFGYTGGVLSTITDPASRVVTFTRSGGNLTQAVMPDGGTWDYAYDGSHDLTKVTDPRSNAVTIAYDSSARVATISRPDSSTDTFTNAQEQGLGAATTVTATLLAAAFGSMTDGRSNTTQDRVDWYGLGTVGQETDALGGVSTYDYNANGLATVAIDQNGNPQHFSYDANGNVLSHTFGDLSSSESWTYNSYSSPLTFIDANGNKTTYAYDAHDNLTKVTDAMLNVTTLTYTGTGQVATYVDPNSHTTSYAYDSQDRLTTITYPTIGSGTSTATMSYSSAGMVTSETNELGYTTTASYDAMNRESGMTNPLGDITTLVYDSGGNLIKSIDPNNLTTSYGYDSMNRLTSVTDPMSEVTSFGYDAAGNQVTVTDPLGHVTTTTFDALNRPTVVTDALSEVTTTSYDAVGNVLTVTDPLGNVTTYTYTSRNEVSTQIDPNGNTFYYYYNALPGQTSSTDYKQSGLLETSTAIFTYNANEQLKTYTDALSEKTTYTYDSGGNEIAVTDPNVHTTSYSYNAREWLVTMTDGAGDVTSYGYDNSGQQTTVTDPLGHVTTTTYDHAGQVISTEAANAGYTTYTYDSGGRMTSLTDPVGNVTTWTYDNAGRVTEETNPLGTRTYTYNSGGELTKYQDRDGRTISYGYDAVGRQTSEQWLNSSGGVLSTIATTYDSAGNVTGLSDPNATLTFAYDHNGNLKTDQTSGGATGQPDVTLTYGYNAMNQVTSLSDGIASGDVISYAYDAAFRMTTITQQIAGTAGPQMIMSYDSGGRMVEQQRTIGGGGSYSIESLITYDAADRILTLTHELGSLGGGGGGAGSPISDGAVMGPAVLGGIIDQFVYSYNSGGLVTQDATYHDGTYTYAYDSVNELTNVGNAITLTYSYDKNGNRTMTGCTTGSDNELTAANGNTYAYDAEGNMTGETDSGGNVWTFAYDHRDRMTGFTEKNSGGTIIAQGTYVYDALDRRIETIESVSGGAATVTWMVYNGFSDTPFAEYSSGGTLEYRYLSGPSYIAGVDALLARTSSGGTTGFYLTDQLGSVTDIVNFSGTVLDHIAYDPFGNILSETSPSNGDQFKFEGMVLDSLLGLSLDDIRYVSAKQGLFVNQDPSGFLGGDTNLYCFVGNDAIGLTDPTGLGPPKEPVFGMTPDHDRPKPHLGRPAPVVPLERPGLGESLIPFWGSFKTGLVDYQEGKPIWGTINIGLALTDFIPIKGVIGLAGKGGWSLGKGALMKTGALWKWGSHTWPAFRKWALKVGLAKPFEPLHHWLIPQRWIWVPEWLKNQPWNLVNVKTQLMHNLIEGKGNPGLGLLGRFWYGTPSWFKALLGYGTGKAANGQRSH